MNYTHGVYVRIICIYIYSTILYAGTIIITITVITISYVLVTHVHIPIINSISNMTYGICIV